MECQINIGVLHCNVGMYSPLVVGNSIHIVSNLNPSLPKVLSHIELKDTGESITIHCMPYYANRGAIITWSFVLS